MQSNGCEKYRELLFDYASDMLDDAESKELEMHINSCPECSGELTEIKAMLAAAAQIEEEKPYIGKPCRRVAQNHAAPQNYIWKSRRGGSFVCRVCGFGCRDIFGRNIR